MKTDFKSIVLKKLAIFSLCTKYKHVFVTPLTILNDTDFFIFDLLDFQDRHTFSSYLETEYKKKKKTKITAKFLNNFLSNFQFEYIEKY